MRWQSKTQWPSNLRGPQEGWFQLQEHLPHLVMISSAYVPSSRGCLQVYLLHQGCCSFSCQCFFHQSDWHEENCCECGHNGSALRCSSSTDQCFSCWQHTWAPRSDHVSVFYENKQIAFIYLITVCLLTNANCVLQLRSF